MPHPGSLSDHNWQPDITAAQPNWPTEPIDSMISAYEGDIRRYHYVVLQS